MTIIGALAPDFDLLHKKLFPHRNIFTHSVFFPLLISFSVFFIPSDSNILFIICAYFNVGFLTHLLGDINPKSWSGGATIKIFWRNRFGRKSFSGRVSLFFLLFNSLLLFSFIFFLVYSFKNLL